MMIYRGAGFLTLLTPIMVILLLMWLWPDANIKQGNTSLMQFLLGAGIGAAINTVLGLVLNRKKQADGAPHHFFFMPMQWPSLAIVIVCTVIAIIKH
ncbi:hypothetical protein [Biostraticola tofi]|uniref:Transmembrane protein n=1 Tax=Biostraticola tofi TaxID=466109 RepID=A0A4R3YUS7_9GAMM|nr:hypothetical protein [Biostraticola tofi]TCV96767.1 hypothetical protein EDC52_104207 [Biostraticola tofi]